MRFSIAALALPIGFAVSQGVTSAIAPKSSAPAGCSANYNGQFQIEVVNVTKSKRDVTERADGELIITLANGILTDSKGRTGYIAANQQFQFDAPAQTGAIYTAGWSVCANGSLAIGNDAIFYQCLSGTFYNLYDENVAAQCSPIYINVISASAAAGATILPDGQVTAAPVSQISDGQPQATTGAPVTQISDGQPQAATSKASASPITQISDGQIQGPKATTSATSSVVGAPVTVISDGQPQVPTGRNSTITSATRTASGTASAVSYTGAAVMPSTFFGLAAGALAVAML